MKLAQSRVHFIGIGGIGMCGLAELLHNMGAQISGSDLGENTQVQHLRKLGIQIDIGHSPDHVEDSNVVVYSSAVKNNNVEFQAARAKRIPLIPRAEALAEIMRLKRGVAIGGTHGKTTTTSLAAAVFLHAQMDPTIVVGGRLDLIQSTAKLGQGDWLIAEADESDGSFSKLSPEMAVITNVDTDHMDYYRSQENLYSAFYDFAARTPFYGLAVVCGDDPGVKAVFKNYPKRILFYGFDPDNDLCLAGEKGKYSLYRDRKKIGNFEMNLPGRHNALNATAAICLGMEAGISFAVCAEGIKNFAGVDRRMQHKGIAEGVEVIDDYGHHPTEVRAVLQAAKEKFPTRRLVVLFQPHRYSRTQLCWQEFTECFDEADKLYLLDIYPAGEKPIRGVSSEALVELIKHPDRVYLAEEHPGKFLNSQIQSGDLVLTLGAGDVWKIGEEILAIRGKGER